MKTVVYAGICGEVMDDEDEDNPVITLRRKKGVTTINKACQIRQLEQSSYMVRIPLYSCSSK